MNPGQKVKKIIFLDSVCGIEKYLENNKEYLFIALRPSVYSYLKQRKMPVQNTLHYFTSESHMKALEKSKILIDWLRKNSDFTDFGIGIQYAYKESFIYWTRLTVHYCLWIAEIVSNIIESYHPQVICARLSGKESVLSLLIEPEERYLAYIAQKVAREKGLGFEDITGDGVRDGKRTVSRFKDYPIKLIFRYVKFGLWEKAVLLKKMFIGKNPVFFITRFYQMEQLARETVARHPDKRLYFLYGPVIPYLRLPDFIIRLFWGKCSNGLRTQEELFEKLETAVKENEELFSYRGVSFAEVISQKIRDNIAPYISGLMLWSTKLNRFIDKTNPAGIISNGSREDNLLLSELCRKKGIPTVLISHGSHVRPKNEYESIEWQEHGRALMGAPFSFFALQSPLAEGYLETFPVSGKAVKTGPLIWGKPVSPQRSKLLFDKLLDGRYHPGKTKIILHAGTPKRGKALRLYVYETPDEYIRTLNELAAAVEKISDAVLIIKFRPQSEISIEDLKNLVPFSGKVLLIVEEPFTDLLGMADLLVSFSSTTIEEALQNRIPVLLYGGDGRYQHVPAYEISPDNPVQKSAVYHLKRAGELEYALSRILNLHIRSDSEKHLFDPYIYPQDTRIAFADLLKSIS